MNSEFWTARLAAAKRQFNMQHHNLHTCSHLDGLNMDDFEVEDEVRPDIPCPYCYEDFDIASLCTHLEEDHSCESRTTVCPICSAKVVRDMLSHIRLQHGQLFKISFILDFIHESSLFFLYVLPHFETLLKPQKALAPKNKPSRTVHWLSVSLKVQ